MRKISILALLLGAVVQTPNVWAEEEVIIEEIVVTATKRETDLMATPLAVQAFDQEKLVQEGITNLVGIGPLVPNMQVGLSPSDSGVQVTMRGITSNNFTELGDPTVAIHVDGMYSPRPQAGLALLHDVERIEVLRGPQGTLFGRNSTSGAINVITSRPDFDGFGAQFDLEAGNYERRAARGWINAPVNDSFGLRLSFMVDKADSYISQTMDEYDFDWDVDGDGRTDGPMDFPADGIPNTDQRRNRDVSDKNAYFNTDKWAARLSMRLAPADSVDWLVTYDYFQDDGAGGISLKDCEKAEGTFFECENDQWSANINVPGEMDFNIQTVRSEFGWDINDSVILEHRIAYSSQERFQQYDGDGGFWADPDHPAYGIQRFCCGAGPLVNDPDAITDLGFEVFSLFPFEDLQLTTRSSQYDSLVTELQFKSAGAGPLHWVVGGFYMEEKNDIRFDVEIPFCCGGAIPLAQSFVQPDRRTESTAVFAQFDYNVTEQLNVTLGYRHTWDEKSDKGGSNHQTIGYWVNPALYDADNTFWHESWGLVGVVDFWARDGNAWQANALTDAMGSLAEDFPERIPGTDNTFDAKWDKGTWRLGVDYLIDDKVFLYGYVATGFKAGGFGDKVDVCLCGDITAFPYKPEENTTFEIGAKTSVLDGTLNLLANVFYSDYSDMQRTTWAIVGESPAGVEVGTLLTSNLDGADIFGAEFEFDWYNPWPNGRVYGWVAYLNAEIGDYPEGADNFFCFERALLGLTECPPEDPSQVQPDNSLRRPADLSGNQLPWSPEWSLTVTAEHNFYITQGMRLTPSVTVNWTDEMFFNDTNFDEGAFHSGQEAVTTVNATLSLVHEPGRWALEAYGYNLGDKLIRSWMDGGPGYLKANFFPPRSYGLRFRKNL